MNTVPNFKANKPPTLFALFLIALVILTIPRSGIITGQETGTNALESTPQIREITMLGSSSLGADPDRMYKDALRDAFYKAYQKVHPAGIQDSLKDPTEGKDLIALQKELNIINYQVLSSWKTENRFYLEIKIEFGESAVESPQVKTTTRLPKLDWVYETFYLIRSISKTNTALAVNTARTIELVAANTGERMKLIKTEQNPHEVGGEQYLVQDGQKLRVIGFNQWNPFNLSYNWNINLPEMLRFSLGQDTLYVIDKNGIIKAFNWEDGTEKWRLVSNSQATIEQLNSNCLLVSLPNREIWALNTRGEKLWNKKLEQKLIATPVAGPKEVSCLFGNGELKIFDLETGRGISTWKITSVTDPKNARLAMGEKELYVIFNDNNNHGHLRVYHRLTGNLLWENSWENPIADSIVTTQDAVIIGIGNSLEARDLLFGLKLWEEPVNGLINKLYRDEGAFFTVAGNRLYRYFY